MKIVIDGRMYQESGIGRYIRNLIFHLQILDTKNQYSVLIGKEEYNNLRLRKNFKKVLTDFKWYGLNEQLRLPGLLNGLKPDLVHFPHFNVPILFDGKFVVTIHDLIHQHFQMRRATMLNPVIYKLKQAGYKKVFKSAVLKSEKILVPSNFVKNLLINEWKINQNKIIVTYEAVGSNLLLNADKIHKVKIREPFVFYVGNAHPHKNVEGLIKAFLEIRKNYQDLNLILSGEDHYFWRKIRKQFQHKDIIYTGKVSDEELVELYTSAKCFVMPSFEEGFGIPLLEAMALGCPVISSNAGSLPEVGGNAALYFDPRSLDEMVEKITLCLNSDKVRGDLIKKGLKRCQAFSWEKLARQTLEVYNQCG